MSNRIRRVLAGVALTALLAVAAAGVAAFLVIPRDGFQEWLGDRLAEAIGPGVVFSSVSLAVWPSPGIQLNGVAFGSEGDGAPTVRTVSCQLELWPLFAGEVVLDHIYLEGLVLSAQRDADGHWTTGIGAALASLRSRDLEADADADEPAAKSDSTPWRGPDLRVRDAVIVLEDRRIQGGPVTLRFENLDADVSAPKEGRPAKLRVSADLSDGAQLEVSAVITEWSGAESIAHAVFEAEVHGTSLDSDSALLYLLFGLPIRNPGGTFDISGSVSGRFSDSIEGTANVTLRGEIVEGWGIRIATPMRLAADFAVEDRHFSMHDARLEAPGFGFSGYTGENLSAVFGWSGRELLFEKLDFDAYGGNLHTAGAVVFAEVPEFSVDVGADRVGFRELVAATSDDAAEGGFETLSAQANLSGRWTGPDRWLDALRGSGNIELTGGEIESHRLIGTIYKALLGEIPGISHLLTGGERGAPNELERLSASFTLRDASAVTDDLVFATSDFRLTGTGSVGFDGSLDFSTNVTLAAGALDRLYGLVSLSLLQPGQISLPAVPVRVRGSLVQPQLVPDVAGLPLAPLHALRGGANAAVGLLNRAARILGGREQAPGTEGAGPEKEGTDGERSSPADQSDRAIDL